MDWYSTTVNPGPCVIALGQFDGVHLGHQQLIDTTIAAANTRNILAAAMLFEPLPRTLLDQDFRPIQTYFERRNLMFHYGLSGVYEVKVNRKFLATSAYDFVKMLVAGQVQVVVVGADFRFGKDRLGDLALLAQHFELIVVPEVCIDERRISSTWCRELICQRQFASYENIVGRPWSCHIEFDAQHKAILPDILLPLPFAAVIVQQERHQELLIKEQVSLHCPTMEQGFASIRGK